MTIQFTNNASTTLASGITAIATSLTVATGAGALFPTPSGAAFFYCTLQNVAGTLREIVKVTARTTDTFTIVRAQDGTSGQIFSTSDKVELRVTAADLNNFGQLDTGNTWATGQTFVAPVLGTPASGTLTNCTFPTLNQNTSGTAANIAGAGIVAVANGGSGVASVTLGSIQVGAGTSAQTEVAPSTSGNVLTSNGTTWTSAAAGGGFATGTRMSFQQTAAPTGWTKDTTAAIDNSACRFVTGSVVNGGSVAFTTAFASQAVSGTNGASAAYTLATADIPSHTHSYTAPASSAYSTSSKGGNPGPVASTTGAQGGGGAHSHGAASFTGTAINLAVKYYDFIIASKN